MTEAERALERAREQAQAAAERVAEQISAAKDAAEHAAALAEAHSRAVLASLELWTERNGGQQARSARHAVGAVPRLTLTKAEAATALGVSGDFFTQHIAHEVRCIRRGRLRLYPVSDLQRWIEQSADHTRSTR